MESGENLIGKPVENEQETAVEYKTFQGEPRVVKMEEGTAGPRGNESAYNFTRVFLEFMIDGKHAVFPAHIRFNYPNPEPIFSVGGVNYDSEPYRPDPNHPNPNPEEFLRKINEYFRSPDWHDFVLHMKGHGVLFEIMGKSSVIPESLKQDPGRLKKLDNTKYILTEHPDWNAVWSGLKIPEMMMTKPPELMSTFDKDNGVVVYTWMFPFTGYFEHAAKRWIDAVKSEENKYWIEEYIPQTQDNDEREFG